MFQPYKSSSGYYKNLITSSRKSFIVINIVYTNNNIMK
jgi:hypothetical protein